MRVQQVVQMLEKVVTFAVMMRARVQGISYVLVESPLAFNGLKEAEMMPQTGNHVTVSFCSQIRCYALLLIPCVV